MNTFDWFKFWISAMKKRGGFVHARHAFLTTKHVLELLALQALVELGRD